MMIGIKEVLLVLLILAAAAGIGGWLLLRFFRASPQFTGVVTGLVLVTFGVLGFVVLATFAYWVVPYDSVDARATRELLRQWEQDRLHEVERQLGKKKTPLPRNNTLDAALGHIDRHSAPEPEPNDFVPVAPVEAVTPVPADPALPATDDRTTVDDAVRAAPDWVRGGVQRRGDVTVLVYSSKQYATEAEADVDARAAVRDYLLDEQRRNSGAEPFRWRATPSVDELVTSVVNDRYVETVQRDFGSMFATMYRVWLKAEITPATYAQLREAHLANVRQGRLMVAGTGLGALLCIPLGIVTYGHLNRRLNHRFSRTLKAGVAAGVLSLWLLGLMLLVHTVTLF